MVEHPRGRLGDVHECTRTAPTEYCTQSSDPASATPRADSPEVETQRTFTNTDQEIFARVEDMAEALESSGLQWHSMAYFKERSVLKCWKSGNGEWAGLFELFGKAMRQLADEYDAEYRAREKEREGDLADCYAGQCHHAERSETVSVTFAACEGFWSETDKMFSGLPEPFPGEITVPGSLISGSLPLLFRFAGLRGPRPDQAEPV